MIAQNEPNQYAAEVPFTLPTLSNPLVGLTGHTFTSGEVQYRLPGATSWANATVSRIIEKGFGEYCLRLLTSETATLGTVYLRAIVSGAQPCVTTEQITNLGGDLAVASSGFIPFYLPQSSDPVNGSPITGHTFAAGEVKICLPNGTFANATLANVMEFGFGSYGLLLTSSDTALNGKAYLHVDIGSSSQPYTGYATILGVGGGVTPTPPTPTPVTPTTSVAGYTASTVDHVAEGILRLCQQFKFTKVPD